MISTYTKETLWDFYKLACKRQALAPVSKPENKLATFFARESIDAVLKYDNYVLGAEFAIQAEMLDEVWLDYAWLIQTEYQNHINNVYTAEPLQAKMEYATIKL